MSTITVEEAIIEATAESTSRLKKYSDDTKVSKNQGASNKGKALVIGDDGVVTCREIISDAEKDYLIGQLFNQAFTCTISNTTPSSSSVSVFNAPDTCVFTLLTKYNGTLVDLDSVPSGWQKTTTGTYIKNVSLNVTGNSKATASSGSTSTSYTGRTKTASSKTVSVYKPVYIITSDATSLTASTIATCITQSNTVTIDNSDNASGDKTINGTKDKYIYYISPAYKTLTIKQMGLSIVEPAYQVTSLTINSKNIGNYNVYRTTSKLGDNTVTATLE